MWTLLHIVCISSCSIGTIHQHFCLDFLELSGIIFILGLRKSLMSSSWKSSNIYWVISVWNKAESSEATFYKGLEGLINIKHRSPVGRVLQHLGIQSFNLSQRCMCTCTRVYTSVRAFASQCPVTLWHWPVLCHPDVESSLPGDRSPEPLVFS